MPALKFFSPKPEPLVGPTGREALLCVGSAGLYVQSLFRAEDALEVGIHAHNDLAREVGIGDGSVGEDERAPARAPLLRRRSSVAGALDQFVLVFGSRTTWSSCQLAEDMG